MSKSKLRTQKEEDIKRFIKLTWEVVRRNTEYREDYRKYLHDYENNSDKLPRTYPLHGWIYAFDPEKGRYVSKDKEKPDPERCNRAYMIRKWGFFCDPDSPILQGAFWQLSFSKEWKEIRKRESPLIQPMADAQMNLQKLPGVLEVERWPEFQASNESLQKYIDAEQELLEFYKIESRQEPVRMPPIQWEVKDSHLNITINLEAPSYLIMHALEFLAEVCKADLKLRNKDIEWDMIPKYLQAWDLRKQKLSDKEISERIPLKRTKPKDSESARPENNAQKEADLEFDGEVNYNILRISDYIQKAQLMIDNGSII